MVVEYIQIISQMTKTAINIARTVRNIISILETSEIREDGELVNLKRRTKRPAGKHIFADSSKFGTGVKLITYDAANIRASATFVKDLKKGSAIFNHVILIYRRNPQLIAFR